MIKDLSFSLGFIFLAGLMSCSPEEQKPDQYNLLFILTDEHRFDTSLPYGNPQIKTPNLNALGQEAVVFEKAYVTQPVCSPARSTILTGHYPHYSTVTANNIPLPDSVPVLPALLPDTFVTSYIGKWHLGSELDVRAGFDERISTEDGYTATDTTRYSDYHQWLLKKGYQPDVELWGTFSRGFCNRLPLEHTKSKYMEGKALEFLEKNQDKPFALYLSFLEPHTPNFGPFDDLHDPSAILLDSTYGDFVPEDESLQYQLKRKPNKEGLEKEKLQEEMAKYWGLVHQVDLSVGAIVAKLKELGLYDNTIIVYTSEHGKMMGKFGLTGKSVLYDPAARVPFFLKVPGVEAKKITYPVSQIDLVPTLLAAMSQEIPPKLPGKSLLPYLDQDHAGNVFVEWHSSYRGVKNQIERCPDGVDEADCLRAAQQMIRTIITPDGYKMCQSVRDSDLSQLFNLNDDPGEVHNLYYKKAYQAKRDSLRKLIIDWQRRVHDDAIL
ncbi:MAG: sulfatase-like hydrolase/transferase [Phaeodactylibacter sp.]|uniref:sulfatase family protein n=1 Tax=Phaeodactylibacter sp. TaxID=1940289 RepID=UPI0032EE3DB9